MNREILQSIKSGYYFLTTWDIQGKEVKAIIIQCGDIVARSGKRKNPGRATGYKSDLNNYIVITVTDGVLSNGSL